MVKQINSDEFVGEVLEAEAPTVVTFTAPARCAPCRALAPVIDQWSEDAQDTKFVKINFDGNVELGTKYNVMSVPTTFLFKNGEPVSVVIGAFPKKKLASDLGL